MEGQRLNKRFISNIKGQRQKTSAQKSGVKGQWSKVRMSEVSGHECK